MKKRGLTIPEIMLIGGTRVALGAGLGLLLSSKLDGEKRRAVGWALFMLGAISTVPLAINVLTKEQVTSEE